MQKIILYLSIYFSIISQVNTEVYRKTKVDSGFQFQSDVNISYKSGNSEYSNYKVFSRINYYTNSFKNFLIYSIKKGSAGKSLYQNQSFFHYRSIAALNESKEIEVFAQYEYNDFINLNDRALYGSYFRIRALDQKSKNRLFIGIGIMKEFESFGVKNTEFNIWRSTNYLTFTYNLSDNLKLISVTYYQFDITQSEDYRILNNSSLNTEITEHIIFKSEFDFRYDNKPFIKISPKDIELSFGLSFFF